VQVLVFAPDRPLLLGGSEDGKVRMWDLETVARAERKPIAIQADKVEPRRKSLTTGDGPEAWSGVGALAADPVTAVQLLAPETRPAPEPDLHGVEGLLRSTRPRVRASGLTILEEAAEMADPVLQELLRQQWPDDVRSRLDGMLTEARGPTKAPARLHALRTLEVLHLIGAAEGWASGREEDEPAPGVRQARAAAWAKIGQLAQGAPGAHLTRRAQAALQRHREWLLFAD
jgi:hypothetical protein